MFIFLWFEPVLLIGHEQSYLKKIFLYIFGNSPSESLNNFL